MLFRTGTHVGLYWIAGGCAIFRDHLAPIEPTMIQEPSPASPFDLYGRSALITGGGYGLGRHIAIAMANAGAAVLIAGRTESALQETCAIITEAGAESHYYVFDATDSSACDQLVEQAVETFGAIDIAAINHGVITVAPPEETSDADWQQVIDVNLSSCFYCARAVGRQMIRQGLGGSIVLTSSNGSLVSFDGLTPYGASKAGVDQLCRQLAAAWGKHGIRVNSVNPGYTENPMGGRKDQIFDQEGEQEIARQTPLARRGRVEEIAAPVVFLASDAASFVSGHCLVVDGGYCAL